MKKNIVVLVGSLRKESYSRKIAKEFIRLSPETLEMNIVEIGNLPLYNPDLEEGTPTAWVEFRKVIAAADGIFFVSPEYNRTMPAAMKNAIDVASRPSINNAWKEKPVAVATTSGSGIGGFGANHAIRQAATFSKVRMFPSELYIGKVEQLFKEDGQTVVEATEKFFKNVMIEFANWVNLFSGR